MLDRFAPSFGDVRFRSRESVERQVLPHDHFFARVLDLQVERCK